MSVLKYAAAALAASTIAGSAIAADLPSRKAPPVYAPIAAPIFTWSGLYVGVNLGYTWSQTDSVALTGISPGFLPVTGFIAPSISAKRDGVIGGGQIGYNMQIGAFVAGVEADIQGIGGGSSNQSAWIGTVVNRASVKQSYLGTVRGRVGIAATPTFLLYATGGLAYGDVKASTGLFNAAIAPAGGVFASNYSTTRAGYTLGAGAEYALSPNLSLKAEYLYYNLGNVNAVALDTTGAFPADWLSHRVRADGHIVRAGVNFRFGGVGGPVVAKY